MTLHSIHDNVARTMLPQSYLYTDMLSGLLANNDYENNDKQCQIDDECNAVSTLIEKALLDTSSDQRTVQKANAAVKSCLNSIDALDVQSSAFAQFMQDKHNVNESLPDRQQNLCMALNALKNKVHEGSQFSELAKNIGKLNQSAHDKLKKISSQYCKSCQYGTQSCSIGDGDWDLNAIINDSNFTDMPIPTTVYVLVFLILFLILSYGVLFIIIAKKRPMSSVGNARR